LRICSATSRRSEHVGTRSGRARWSRSL
jgi:hypothetical protein